MNVLANSEQSTVSTPFWRLTSLWIVFAAVAISLTGMLLFDRLPLIVIAGVTAVAGLIMIRWPDSTTLIALGLVYSNLAVVAVRYHGAPSVLPAAVLAMFGWPFFYHLILQREKVRLLSATPFIAAFAVVQLCGVLFAREPSVAFEHFVSFLLEGVLVYLFIINVVRIRRMAVGAFWVLALCALVMGGVPFLQQVTGTFGSDYGGLAQADSQFAADEDAVQGVIRQQRAAGTIGEQNRYAQFMIMLAPIGFALVGIARSNRLRFLAVCATFAALLGFALAFSRGAAVGLGLTFVAAVALKLLRGKQIRLVLGAAAIVLLLLPQYLARLSSVGLLVGVVGSGDAAVSQADGAVRGRLTEMGAAVLIFRDHPLIGVGPGMFGLYSKDYGQMIGLRSLGEGRQAHSLPLDIAAEHGFVGLITMLGLFFVLIRKLLRTRNSSVARGDNEGTQLCTGMLLMLLLYLTTSLFLHLSFIRYFWLTIALADAIGYIVATDHERHLATKALEPA